MVDVVKATLDVSFYKPTDAGKGPLDLCQCSMTASIGAKAMGRLLEVGFVNAFQYYEDSFLYQFVIR